MGSSVAQTQRSRKLILIKLAHTVIWAFFVACILLIPVAGSLARFRWAWTLSGAVLVECLVLAANGGRCPLTLLAARFTGERSPAFDIYLPNCLARWNKLLFGSIFVAGELFLLWRQFW